MDPIDVWLSIPPGEEEAEYEANTFLRDDKYEVEWYHTAVGVVSTRVFNTYEDAVKFLEDEGFEDFSS